MAEAKPVSIVVTSGLKIEGEHHEVGEVLRDIPHALAAELIGAGRARPADAKDLAVAAEAKAKAKA